MANPKDGCLSTTYANAIAERNSSSEETNYPNLLIPADVLRNRKNLNQEDPMTGR